MRRSSPAEGRKVRDRERCNRAAASISSPLGGEYLRIGGEVRFIPSAEENARRILLLFSYTGGIVEHEEDWSQ